MTGDGGTELLAQGRRCHQCPSLCSSSLQQQGDFLECSGLLENSGTPLMTGAIL